MRMSQGKLIVLAMIFPLLAIAQSGSSAISGTVKDATGSPIFNAKGKVVNEQTGNVQDTATNEEGLYRAGSLLPGFYRVEVEAAGFQKLVRGRITREVGQAIAWDLAVSVGQ